MNRHTETLFDEQKHLVWALIVLLIIYDERQQCYNLAACVFFFGLASVPKFVHPVPLRVPKNFGPPPTRK